jgi:TolA-binding protein
VRIRLDDGTLHVGVTHGASEKRLVFLVPDGTIQDLGTTFSVTVAKGRTRAVSVSEGRVALRLRGRATIQIAAGGSWEAPPGPSSNEHREVAASASAHGEVPTAGCSEDAIWTDAMSSFHADRYAEAAAAFETFVAKCPDDRRSEDAAYLRMVALARAGRQEEARAAAHRYLMRYPHGFRRQESQRFLDSAETPKGP